MTARETLAIVLAIEALRLEWRATFSKDVEPQRALADEQATAALGIARQAVDAELPAELRRDPVGEVKS